MTAADKIARGLAIAGTMAGAGAVFAFLPPASFGIFGRSEIVVIAAFAAGILCAAGLALLADLRRTASPLAVAFACLALWSLAVSPLAEYPMRTLLGLPQSGEGALLLFALAAIAGAVAVVGQRGALAWLCVAAAVGAALWQAVLPAEWIPWSVPAPLAWLGIAAWGALATAPGNRRNNLVAACAVLGLTLVVAMNKSAALLVFALGLPLFVGARFVDPEKLRRLGVVLVSMVIPATSAAVWWLGAHGYGESLVSRARIYDVLAAAFVDRPVGLLVGFGWGGVAEAFFRHLPAGADRLYGDSWDMLARDFSNAHNVALDFWFAAGLPGLVLVLVLPALIVWRARARDLPVAIAFAVVWAGHSVLWYQEAYGWAASVIAFALIARRPLALRFPAAIRAVPAFAAVALVVGAAWLADYGVHARRALDAAPPSACLADFPDDPMRGDMGLRHALGQAMQDGEPSRIAALVCAVDRRFAAAPSLHLAIAGAFQRAQAGDARADWPVYVDALLAFAPLRTDLAVPYLAHLVAAEDWPLLAARTDAMTARNPQDPVGLWFSGMGMIRSPEGIVRQAGFARLRMALALGFGRMVPLPEETRRQVESGG